MQNYPKLSLYIDGEFLSGQGRVEQDVINPANLQVIAKLPHASEADLDLALSSAQRAFQTWRKTSPLERGAILRRAAQLCRDRADEIGRHMTLDQGKILSEAITEVRACADHCDWHAEEARRIYGRIIPARTDNVRQLVLREPVGVCAAFTPWNFPFNQAIRKISAAIAAGCTIIIKGPEDAPSAVLAIAQAFHDAGLPKGVLNVVWGVPSEVSDYLIASPIVRKISFTGSVPVGKLLAAKAGAQMKPITMELGGHSPVIVFDDVDFEQIIPSLVKFKLRNAGQACIAPTRFFVQSTRYEAFVAAFVKAMQAVVVGDGLDPKSMMGALANRKRVDTMREMVADALSKGAILETGGQALDQGYFYLPTVLTNVNNHMRIMNEEPFGPIATISPFETIDEVIEQANRLAYGLADYVFTHHYPTQHRLSNELEAGMININHFGSSLPETPFGGVKDSGIGSEGGSESLDGYLLTKFVTMKA